MSSSSNSRKKRSRTESEASGSPENDSQSTKRIRRQSVAVLSSAPTDGISSPRISGSHPGRAHEEEICHPAAQPQDGPSDDDAMETDLEEMFITGIRAVDVALGLRRLPAGFYTTVRHSGHEWRTENKRSSVNPDLVEWTGPIPIPSNLSSTVVFEVYASFEFQPVLGAGERLRRLTVAVEQLLDRSAGDISFRFFPKDGDVVSPCSSLSVTVQRQIGLPMPKVLLPYRPSPELPAELEDITNQGHSALSRYRKEGRKQDLEQSIAKFERAYSICPVDHPSRTAAQANLAMAEFILCQVEGITASVWISRSLYLDMVHARPIGHIDCPSTLIQLSATYFALCDKPEDKVERACEALLREAMDLSPRESHENRAARVMLRLLAVRRVPEQNPTSGLIDQDPWIASDVLLRRYRRSNKLDDLEQAIAITRDLVRTTSIQDVSYPRGLSNLGVALLDRFELLEELHDLDDAIRTLKDAAQFTSHGHPGEFWRLPLALFNRFVHLGEPCDLDDCISIFKDAVESLHDHRCAGCLDILGHFLLARFNFRGNFEDLDDAISTHRDALRLTHCGDTRSDFLNSLSDSLLVRFGHLKNRHDLQDAISTDKDILQFIPHGHSSRPDLLNNLGRSLFARFKHNGDLHDLDDAISAHRSALQLSLNDHEPNYLNGLGNSLLTRFERHGDIRDLDDAISTYKDILQFIPHGHTDRPAFLSQLGDSLRSRFEHLGDLHDIDDAISTHKDALQLIPHGHINRPQVFNNLGESLLARFEHLGELCDLDDAISAHRDALQLTPHDTSGKLQRLHVLGGSIFTRYMYLSEAHDLDNAILILKDVVRLTPYGDHVKPSVLHDLGHYLFNRFLRDDKLCDLEIAMSIFLYAACAPFGSVSTRFHICEHWIWCARHARHHTLLHAYAVAISLLPRFAWIGFSLEQRYSELVQLGQRATVVGEAAAAALDAELPELAVEWLEQGRSIVWGEQFQLRSSYQELASAHPDYAHRLQELSIALSHASAAREQSISARSSGTGGMMDRVSDPLRRDADQHQALAIERDELLKEIRKLPGFGGFLRYKRFSELRASAHAGPVVMLNATKSRCDALIILAGVDHVIHVPLPNFTLNQSIYCRNAMRNLLVRALAIPIDERDAEVVPCEDISWESLLSDLWMDVVKPVLDAMAFSVPGDLRRIFWCPTGPFAFLPIHATGIYGTEYLQPGHQVSDFVISSYIPSLSILTPPPNPIVEPDHHLRLLAVRQPDSDGLFHLREVPTELKHISDVINRFPSSCIHLVEPAVATVEEVLSQMREADWVHFACHGIQAGVDSGLCLADKGRLRVRDMIALQRPRGGLAFLSACQTAMGDARLPDEALHITAGMLYAGYEGVIGTMWSISDSLAPAVAKGVYRYLLRNGTRLDSREAARALHEAIGCVRKNGMASFQEWVPFIHVGL